MKMTKLITFALAVAIFSLAQAKPAKTIKPITKEAYLASAKATVEKKGKTFNAKKTAARFDRIDTNKDGIASVDERKAFAAKMKKNKKK